MVGAEEICFWGQLKFVEWLSNFEEHTQKKKTNKQTNKQN